MSDWVVDKSGDTGKNITLRVSGFITKSFTIPQTIFDFSELRLNPSKIRFESVVFAIQEKMGMYLWWKGKESNKTLILPLESRGAFNFEAMQYLHSPEDALGMSFTTFGVDTPKAFLLIIDLGAQ